MNGELLLEVRCEEIPARMLEAAIKELTQRTFEDLMGRGVGPREVETGFTPRRLVLVLKGLPARQDDQMATEIGPPKSAAFGADGQPTPAAVGFARKCGVDVSELRVKDFSLAETPLGAAGQAGKAKAKPTGERVYVERHVSGKPTQEILAELLPPILLGIGWAKTMRWGSGIGPWVRPVHGVVALFDGEVVPIELFGVRAGRTTVGHPTLSPAPFEVADSADYRRQLAERGIEVRFDVRCRRLAEEMGARAAAAGGTLVDDPGLLAKLGAICEIPGVMEGAFDPALLALPREVLGTSLRDHQSAFTVEKDGAMLPLFLTVMDRPDDPVGRVRAGNEWVVAARLADARFFWDEDRKAPLAARFEELAHLTFHEKLGSYQDKAIRLATLAPAICAAVGWREEEGAAAEAARLLKADLITNMVKEFTSLQGIMGGIYAREQGHSESVWQAIYDQYLPASVDDRLPRGHVGIACGLADRIDTLVGMFGLGLVPTGTKDPFGLRRAAQGVLRILLETELPLALDQPVRRAASLYGDRLKRNADQILADLRPFLADRLRYLLGRQELTYDEIEAAFGGAEEDERTVADVAARARALHQVRDEQAFLAVVLAAKRIANITKGQSDHALDAAVLAEPSERALHEAHARLAAEIDAAVGRRDYAAALRSIVSLADPLERFFTDVMVMVDDAAVRSNRLALLQSIGRTLSRVARLTEMVVEKADYR
ncbi:MAG TPA: glycine--tRNA ligase subunit beta [Thermoanaerobaculia bacterium]|nr:glycine--tRNA ligase subunit beta [Thermoanaerobaculia bacterium]